MDTKEKKKKISPYMVFSTIVIILLAIAFAFPLYWILTGSFKTQISINSTTPEWWPSEWVMTNYEKLFSRQKSPLWEFAVPFSSRFMGNRYRTSTHARITPITALIAEAANAVSRLTRKLDSTRGLVMVSQNSAGLSFAV